MLWEAVACKLEETAAYFPVLCFASLRDWQFYVTIFAGTEMAIIIVLEKPGGGKMGKTISIGARSFEFIREKDCFFVDKTGFIKEWWENQDAVTLITRPRRFGKTLNLDMLNCFFLRNIKEGEICLRASLSGKIRNTGSSRGVIR